MTGRVVEIVTTAHWEGDPRLNRHVRYLTHGGHAASLTSFKGSGRTSAIWQAVLAIVRSRAQIILIPDPEMFLPGSLAARLSGKLPVIDIHEDYGKAATARAWVPAWARPLVRAMANIAVWGGRLVTWRVLVAAPELSRSGDFVALNVPDPGSLPQAGYDGSRRLVYVGDVTTARGALTMIEVLAELDDTFELLLIGRVGEETAKTMMDAARAHGVDKQIEMTGRLGHDEAWQMARGCLAGLNLLAPVPAYQQAVATKLWEYMAIGLPPIVSDLPGQRRLVSQIDPDLVCASPAEAASIATALAKNPERRSSLAAIGPKLVEEAWADSRPDLAVQAVVEP